MNEKFMITISFIFITVLLFTLFLYPWVSDNDIANISKSGFNRMIDLFYYGIVTFTTTGYGDIYPKSYRMKLIIAFYLIMIYSIPISMILNTHQHIVQHL